MWMTLSDLISYLQNEQKKIDADPIIQLVNPVNRKALLKERDVEDVMRYNKDTFFFEIYV
jgi:hypothetical protein